MTKNQEATRKHTPIPWDHIVEGGPHEADWIAGGPALDAAGTRVTVFPYAADLSPADLKLVLAAPYLLEALEALLAGCDHHKIYTGSQGDRARAAIAKAVGA